MKFFPWLVLFGLMLCSCTQRTVVTTKQSYSFSERLTGVTGGSDDEKIREKFAGGFEIKDGEVVATGNKKNPFEGKEFEIREFQGAETSRESGRESGDNKKLFSGLRDFRTKAFDTGDPARDSSKVSSYASQDSGFGSSSYETSEWSRAAEKFRTSDNPDSAKVFFGPKNAREQSARSVDAQVTASAMDGLSGNGSNLTVDQVRKMLHPDKYE